ncbi:MAG: hypothetical protein LBH40_04060 [Alphaproteobacteria bacterium]|jgi:hypothetical protein|nr:hypothetical protein [Alphaproteobacteria bacterium]
MKYLTLGIYVGLGLLHLYIVKNIMFLLILVGLFEAVRLVAVYNKVKPIVITLAIFSVGFLGMNYYSLYNNTSTKAELSTKLSNNLDNYSNSYWTNQSNYMEIINKQEKLIDNISNSQLPNPIMVWVLISLIELSLAYMVIMQSNTTPIPGKKKGLQKILNLGKSNENVSPIPQDLKINKVSNKTSSSIPLLNYSNLDVLVDKVDKEEIPKEKLILEAKRLPLREFSQRYNYGKSQYYNFRNSNLKSA